MAILHDIDTILFLSNLNEQRECKYEEKKIQMSKNVRLENRNNIDINNRYIKRK